MSIEKIFSIVKSLYFVHGAENVHVNFEDGRYLLEIEGEIISDEIHEAMANL